MRFLVAIPARYGATRLPGKPLLMLAGKPMIQHVYERALESGAQRVIVATDDGRIAEAARGFGAEVVMTGSQHRSGSERLAEAAMLIGCDDQEILVNVQGDEPLIPPALIRQAAEALQTHADASVATLGGPIETVDEIFDPNVVKIVRDAGGYALYFSRAPIPWARETFAAQAPSVAPGGPYLRHVGIYAYRVGFLKTYVSWQPCALETLEALEQLRVLWHGARIIVADAVVPPAPDVNTEADRQRVEALLRDRG